MERSVDKKALISALSLSPHGDLKQYLPVCLKGAAQDPEFVAHLIAYNHHKGQIRDAKIALPVIALMAWRAGQQDREFAENALAHYADLRPKEFLRGLAFAKDVSAPQRILRRLTERYLIDLERDRSEWNRTALHHRRPMRELYARWAFTAPGRAATKTDWPHEKAVLFGKAPAGSVFEKLASLKTLSPEEIAGTVTKYNLPMLAVRGALEGKAADPDVVLALMKRMTPAQLVTEMRWLERVGVKRIPALRAQLEESLGKAAKQKKAKSTLKTTKAAEALADDEQLSGKLRVLQEKQIDRVASIEGDWLVLGDKSGSMEVAIEMAKQVAGVLARLVKGKVYLVYFDTEPRFFDVTGKSLEDIQALTKSIYANNGTSIGCGVQYCTERKLKVDGIAIVSDGCENAHPYFCTAYTAYKQRLDAEPTVYFYQTATAIPKEAVDRHGLRPCQEEADRQLQAFFANCRTHGIDLQRFDLTKGTDYHALPNLAQTMRVARYALFDEVLSYRLRTLDEVLDRTVGLSVLPQRTLVTA
jgi:hypothetical protein